jgi:hypothetical protein
MSTTGVDLTDLASVKEWLGEPAPVGADTLLAHLITEVSAWVQNYTERSFWSAIYTQVVDGSGGHTMLLAEKPVISVASVHVADFTVPQAATLGGIGWSVSDQRLTLNGYRFIKGYSNIQVIYTAGYSIAIAGGVISGVPQDLQLAVNQLVGLRYKERIRYGKTSENMAGQTTSYLVHEIPYDVRQALGNYRKVAPW